MRINEFIPNTSLYNNVTLKDDAEVEQSSNGVGNFQKMLSEELNKVNDKQIQSENTTDKFIKGDDVDIHQVMLKTEEAKLSLQLAVQVRNKLLEAYQEINRMQV